MKNKKKNSNIKEFLLEFFGELSIFLVIIILGIVGIWLLPFDFPKDLDFEIVIFIGLIVTLPFILLIGFIIYFIKIGHKMKEFKLIKKSFKNKYKLVLISTTKFIDGKEYHLPLLIGNNKKGKFRLIQDIDKLIFYIEYNNELNKEDQTLYPKDSLEAVSLIEEFMMEDTYE